MTPITTLIIEPGRAARNYWGDLWRYRELLYFLAWRDIVVRYKQTIIGIAWALIRPALTMLVFVAFRRLAGMPSSNVPEAVLVFTAVLPWQFFSAALSESSASLIGNSSLVGKVYFPRLIIPLASIVTSFVDFLVTLGLLALLLTWYGLAPGVELAALPFFVLLVFALSLGMGLLLSALNVRFRDFRYIVPFVVQFGLFISPIAFSTSDVPERWRAIYALNPIVGIIDGFRWSILAGRTPMDSHAVLTSVVVTSAILALGIWHFRRVERTFADVI